MTSRLFVAGALAAALLGGCTYYVAPGAAPGAYYATAPASGFDRSWSAVLGAFACSARSPTRASP